MKYLKCVKLVPSLARAGWTLSMYKQRIKWTLLNRFMDTATHVYRWLKFSPASPIVCEADYWSKRFDQ